MPRNTDLDLRNNLFAMLEEIDDPEHGKVDYDKVKAKINIAKAIIGLKKEQNVNNSIKLDVMKLYAEHSGNISKENVDRLIGDAE